MNGRIYDPLLGRFLSADSYIDGAFNLQGYNRYTYVHNNPLTLTDPTGYMSHSEERRRRERQRERRNRSENEDITDTNSVDTGSDANVESPSGNLGGNRDEPKTTVTLGEIEYSDYGIKDSSSAEQEAASDLVDPDIRWYEYRMRQIDQSYPRQRFSNPWANNPGLLPPMTVQVNHFTNIHSKMPAETGEWAVVGAVYVLAGAEIFLVSEGSVLVYKTWRAGKVVYRVVRNRPGIGEWNKFQSALKGLGMNSSQMSALYQPYQSLLLAPANGYAFVTSLGAAEYAAGYGATTFAGGFMYGMNSSFDPNSTLGAGVMAPVVLPFQLGSMAGTLYDQAANYFTSDE
jgi:hypothetical protein